MIIFFRVEGTIHAYSIVQVYSTIQVYDIVDVYGYYSYEMIGADPSKSSLW